MARNLTSAQNSLRKSMVAVAKAEGWQFDWFPSLGVTVVSFALGETTRVFWSRAASTEPVATRKAGEYHAMMQPAYLEGEPECSGQCFNASGFYAEGLAHMVSAGYRDEETGELLE